MPDAEARERALKALHAAALLADGYGWPKTAQEFREVRDALADSEAHAHATRREEETMWVTIQRTTLVKILTLLRDKNMEVKPGSDEHREIAILILQVAEALEAGTGD